MDRIRLQALVLAAALAAAGTAVAEPLKAAAPKSEPDLAAAVFARKAETMPLRTPGVAKTSVDYSSPTDGVTGSLGFLCGLNPGAGRTGAAAARGYDPAGRFVGAKLSFAFR
jgi:hypothetical protein